MKEYFGNDENKENDTFKMKSPSDRALPLFESPLLHQLQSTSSSQVRHPSPSFSTSLSPSSSPSSFPSHLSILISEMTERIRCSRRNFDLISDAVGMLEVTRNWVGDKNMKYLNRNENKNFSIGLNQNSNKNFNIANDSDFYDNSNKINIVEGNNSIGDEKIKTVKTAKWSQMGSFADVEDEDILDNKLNDLKNQLNNNDSNYNKNNNHSNNNHNNNDNNINFV